MKPISRDAMKRMALAHGGRLEIDGQRVNSARLQVVTAAPKPAPASAPAYMPPEPKQEAPRTIEAKPDPAVREALLSIDNYAASQFLMNEQLVSSVKEAMRLSASQTPETRPTKWVFTVKRDAQGLMETITATAK